ncbi:DUF1827 family protein [Enterococcus canis]|nr:DUF1827 family protein [Enterococcus canis]
MKLVKSNLNTTVALRRVYPIICSYLFRDMRIKSYEIYTLDRTTILKVDTFDSIVLVIFNKRTKIRPDEIDFICRELLPEVPKENLLRIDNVLQKMAEEELYFEAKDFVVLQADVDE